MLNRSTDVFVLSYTHLKDRPKADQALPMLQKVASLVKPIMRKHGWVLPVLSEFFPESPNLIGLNVNAGQKILLRLRPAWAPDTFYEEDNIVRTMLHELTHNVRGPHDEQFYKILAGLENEYEALQRSGYSGEGFFSKGHRVGANVSHDLPPHLSRGKALEAAEKRRRIGGMLGSGGKLGGSNAGRKGTPRQLAAEAAERRARDEKSCGSGDLARREAEKASKESIEDKVIDLTGDGEDLDSDIIILDQNPALPGSSNVTTSQPKGLAKSMPTSASNASLPRSTIAASSSSQDRLAATLTRSTGSSEPSITTRSGWSCTICTLLNEPLTPQCAACLTTRSQDISVGWTCLTCTEQDNPHEFWTCRFCGSVKIESALG